MKKYQSMSYENLLARNSAEYIFAMNQLVNMYCGNVLIMALRMVIDGILILTILLLLFWFNPIPLIMLSLLFSLVYFGYEKVFGKRLKYLGEIFNQASHKLISLMNESIHGVKNIRVYGKKDRFINEFFKVNKRHGTTYAQLTFRSMIPKYLFEFIMVLFVVFFVLISIFLGIKDILPAIAMFSVAAVRVIPAANNLTSGLVQLRFNRDAVSRLYDDIVRTKYYEKEKKLKYGKINKFKTLNIDNICFKFSLLE